MERLHPPSTTITSSSVKVSTVSQDNFICDQHFNLQIHFKDPVELVENTSCYFSFNQTNHVLKNRFLLYVDQTIQDLKDWSSRHWLIIYNNINFFWRTPCEVQPSDCRRSFQVSPVSDCVNDFLRGGAGCDDDPLTANISVLVHNNWLHPRLKLSAVWSADLRPATKHNLMSQEEPHDPGQLQFDALCTRGQRYPEFPADASHPASTVNIRASELLSDTRVFVKEAADDFQSRWESLQIRKSREKLLHSFIHLLDEWVLIHEMQRLEEEPWLAGRDGGAVR